MSEDRDEYFMRLALRLAVRGRTSPNPRVGAVVVHDGRVLSVGWHHAAGQAHAEVEALEPLQYRAEGATLYVNLEPCSHYGRTPPCTDAILRSGIRRVVAGMVDPNPLVRGAGFARLEAHGVEVRSGVLEAECRRLNEGFIKSILTGFPFVTLKVAATADGKTATRTRASKWITGDAARLQVHRARARHDAVLTGVGTVLADSPQLTARLDRRRQGAVVQPLRVVLDSQLRTPVDSPILSPDAGTLIICTPEASAERWKRLEGSGAEVIAVPAVNERVSLTAALQLLHARGITYVMAECGAILSGALVAAGLVDRYWFFYAPMLFGGQLAPGMIGGNGVEAVADAPALEFTRVRRIGPDLWVEARPRGWQERLS